MTEEIENGESFYGFRREDLTDEDVEKVVRENYKIEDDRTLRRYTIRCVWGMAASAALTIGGLTMIQDPSRAREINTIETRLSNLEGVAQEANSRINELKNSDGYRTYQESSTLPFLIAMSGVLGFFASPVLAFGFGNSYLVKNKRKMNEELWNLIPERMQEQKEEQNRRLVEWAKSFLNREFPEKPDDDKPYKQRSYVK